MRESIFLLEVNKHQNMHLFSKKNLVLVVYSTEEGRFFFFFSFKQQKSDELIISLIVLKTRTLGFRNWLPVTFKSACSRDITLTASLKSNLMRIDCQNFHIQSDEFLGRPQLMTSVQKRQWSSSIQKNCEKNKKKSNVNGRKEHTILRLTI